jgi:membrane protein DedA with SNARE-associated domain
MNSSQNEPAPVKVLLHSFFVWIMTTLQSGGYPAIVLLMAMESSVFPVPSELVIPPAAYWASRGEMSYLGVILAGTFGCWLGASATYWVSYLLGRPLLVRYGKYFFVPQRKLEMAEAWVLEYGVAGVFFSRLLPVVRHLIGIPAGLCRMNFWHFSWTTVVGSAIWCSVLAWFGPQMITPEMFQDADAMVKEIKHRTHIFALLVLLVGGLYGLMKYLAKRRQRLNDARAH